MFGKLLLRRGVEANLPLLHVGEPAFTTDTKKLYVGSGSGNVEMPKKSDVDTLSAGVNTLSTQIASHTTSIATNTAATEANTAAITNMGSGSPKGTYATLVALQTAFPTGTTGVYVVVADGKWYYWGGSSWTAGGVYQSTALASNSGDQLVQIYNLVDYSMITTGYYLGAGGTPVADNYSYSDYIAVTPGVTYTFYGPFSKSFVAATYNGSKAYLSTIFTNDSNITGAYRNFHYTVPAGVSFVRFNMNNALQTQLSSMVLQGNVTYPATYTAFGQLLLSSSLAQGIKNSLNLGVLYSDDQFNTAIGQGNLINKNSTMYATAVGYGALKNNTTDGSQDAGLYNTAIGYAALMSNTVGNHNTAVGWQAGRTNTTGTGLTAVGEDSLLSNTTGIDNTMVGIRSGQNITTGSENTALGAASLYSANPSAAVVTGANNTAIGAQAGSRTVADTNCTYLGFFANKDTYANSYSNSTAIGSNAVISKSNQVVLGNTSVTEVDTYGDFQCLTNGKGLILSSPDGTRYRLTISNSGVLTTASI